MDELLALLERYAPGYRARVTGADERALDSLEARFQRPLPAFYRQFAQAMGADAGPLLSDVESYDPDHIDRLYLIARWVSPQRYLCVFGDPSFDAQHYFLDLDSLSGDDCAVVRFSFERDPTRTPPFRAYVSLREMLFLQAMCKVHLPSYPHRAALMPRAARLVEGASGSEPFAALCARLGFARLPFPRRCMLFERGDAAIGLYRNPDAEAFSIQVGMRDPGELRRFEALLGESAGMVRL